MMLQHIIESNLIESVDDQDEVTQSLKAWEYLKDKQHMTREVLLRTHFLIMERQWPEIAGRLRKENVQVGGYVTPHYTLVPQRLTHWLWDMSNALTPDLAAVLNYNPRAMHVSFEHIHPFRDGNGRVGRMLMWWHEVRLNQEPTLIKYDNRWSYYNWF